MRTDDFDYFLPPERIAQTPVEPRDAARLMVVNRKTRAVEHTYFHQVGKYLRTGDVLILNETKVIPARIYGWKAESGGKVEILLLRREDNTTWEVLVGGKGIREGKVIAFNDGVRGDVIEVLDGSRRRVQFNQPIESKLSQLGHTPLPPYIHEPLRDPGRYQTVYARLEGSVAAPTAGMHFTERLMGELEENGVLFGKLTLHIGLDTFTPVTESNPEEHKIHTEWCDVPDETVNLIKKTKEAGGRVIAVGTTSVRALESAARDSINGNLLTPYRGATDLYILPGYQFRVVDGMITNFHLPKSTLLMLVAAFTESEWILELYREAVERGYRFYSFGDAMLIL